MLAVLRNSLQDASRWFIPSIFRCWPTLLILVLLTTGLHEYFSIIKKYAVMDNEQMLLAMMGQVLTDLMVAGILIIVIPLRLHEIDNNKSPQSWFSFASQHIWPLTIESLRVITSVLLWSLLFIIPGIFRYTRLSLYPYVIYFDNDYKEGKKDVLTASNDLVRGVGLIIFLILVLPIVPYLISHDLIKNLTGILHLQSLFGVKIFNTLISVFTYGMFYSIFKQQQKKLLVKKET